MWAEWFLLSSSSFAQTGTPDSLMNTAVLSAEGYPGIHRASPSMVGRQAKSWFSGSAVLGSLEGGVLLSLRLYHRGVPKTLRYAILCACNAVVWSVLSSASQCTLVLFWIGGSRDDFCCVLCVAGAIFSSASS